VLTTEAELIVEVGVDATRSIDCGTGLVDGSNSSRGVRAVDAEPVGELSRCRPVRSDSARDRICMDAICAAARCLAGLRSTKSSSKAGMRALFLPCFCCCFGTVLDVLPVGVSTESRNVGSRSSSKLAGAAVGSDAGARAASTLVAGFTEWGITEGSEGLADDSVGTASSARVATTLDGAA
jgi:hypothetical protein